MMISFSIFIQKPLYSLAHHPFSPSGAPLRGEVEANEKFAVFKFSGRQYKASVVIFDAMHHEQITTKFIFSHIYQNDVVVVDNIRGENIDISDQLEISDVLMVGSRTQTIIGRPNVPKARILASVEEITKDKKVVVFKMRRRKNSKRTKGFRRQIVVLRVTDIVIDGSHSP